MTIGGSHATSAFFLPSVLAVYMQTHPHVAVALRSDTSRGIVRRVLSLELDIGAVTDAPEDPHLAIETLRQEKLVAFVSAKHPLAKTARMSLADLTKAPLVVKAEGSACAAFVRQTRERGLEPNIVMQCQSPMAVKVAVRKGAGVGLLYQEIVERDKGNGLKILKVPDLKITGWTSVVYHKERLLSAPVRDFLDLLRQWPKRQKLV
jgi:DNA-binding transcriptional LysR family regulator